VDSVYTSGEGTSLGGGMYKKPEETALTGPISIYKLVPKVVLSDGMTG
jgi:hypothetical protein